MSRNGSLSEATQPQARTRTQAHVLEPEIETPQADGPGIGPANDTALRTDALVHRDPAWLIDEFRQSVRGGQLWFEALLRTIAAWETPVEIIDDREYRYLIGREAFDWLVLAERICDAAEGDALLPADEVEALLIHEEPPGPLSEETFQICLGAAKYRAHLNFVYGVRVEEALQLAVEQQVEKERGSLTLSHDARIEQDALHRIYGATRSDLLRQFRDARSLPNESRISLTEWKEFTYWLFKLRLQMQDPARVASDTRRGILTLHQMDELKRQRRARSGSTREPTPFPDPDRIIDGVAVRVP